MGIYRIAGNADHPRTGFTMIHGIVQWVLGSGRLRSHKWPAVRDAHLKTEPTCTACGETRNLEVHHVEPFHLSPERELDPSNLLTMCRDCHWFLGHLQHWDRINPHARADAEYFLRRVREVLR